MRTLQKLPCATKIYSAICKAAFFLLGCFLSSCTITYHWKTYPGPQLQKNEFAVLKSKLGAGGFKITSIDGWAKPERIPIMAWDDAYDLTTGTHQIRGFCDHTVTVNYQIGSLYETLKTTRHVMTLHLNAQSGHAYKIIGGQNHFLPGYPYSEPQIIDLTSKRE